MILLAPLDHITPFSPARRYTFAKKYLSNPSETHGLQDWLFAAVALFCASRLRILMASLENVMYFHSFFIQLSVFLKGYHTF